jgi:hypothetical protein
VPEPGHADPIPAGEALDFGPGLIDAAHDLVAWHDRQLGIGQVAVHDVEVGPAHGASLDADTKLVGLRQQLGPVLQNERAADLTKDHGSHVALSP